jgi:hypothetical protein
VNTFFLQLSLAAISSNLRLFLFFFFFVSSSSPSPLFFFFVRSFFQVNCAKQKKLTNVRSSGADEKLTLQPPRKMSLEDYITYMAQDEVLGTCRFFLPVGTFQRPLFPSTLFIKWDNSCFFLPLFIYVFLSLFIFSFFFVFPQVLEVTPNGIRLRKRHLDAGMRARAQRDKKAASQGKKK